VPFRRVARRVNPRQARRESSPRHSHDRLRSHAAQPRIVPGALETPTEPFPLSVLLPGHALHNDLRENPSLPVHALPRPTTLGTRFPRSTRTSPLRKGKRNSRKPAPRPARTTAQPPTGGRLLLRQWLLVEQAEEGGDDREPGGHATRRRGDQYAVWCLACGVVLWERIDRATLV
jgi:hypothetical protein